MALKRLGEEIDDTQTFTVAVTPPVEEGSGRVENLSFPVQVPANEPFDIEYDCRNVGATDTMWGHMLDRDTGIEVVGSRWEEEIVADGTKHVITHFDGITADFNGRVEVGHIVT